jgi:hypothetical protein
VRIQSRALAAALVATLGVLAVPGAAYAYWTALGSGSGSAAAGSVSLSAQAPSVLEINGALSVGSLVPGGTGGAVLKVTNPNGFAVTVVSVTAGLGAVAAQNGCSPTGVSWLDSTNLAGPTIPANTTQTFTLTDAVAMDTTSANSCLGTTFTIPVTVTVSR